jgi:hypothetical protein
MDVEGYYHIDWERGGERCLQIRPSEFADAKNRIEGHFDFADGKPMEFVPMGFSKEQAFQNFERAFNNQWTQAEIQKGGQKAGKSQELTGKGLSRSPQKKLTTLKRNK